jgi:uncharacterized repeat protein (TIGR02543 family)
VEGSYFWIDNSSGSEKQVSGTAAGSVSVTVEDTFALEDLSLYAGESKKAKVSAPAPYQDAAQIWYTVDTSIAIVDSEGTVRGRKAGETDLYLTAGDVTKSAKVRVVDFTLSLSKPPVSIKPGDSWQFSVSGFPDDYSGDKSGVWGSSGEGIVSVDEDGAAAAVGGGSCTVTFTHTLTGKTATAQVTVNVQNVAFTVHVTPPTLSLWEGDTADLYYYYEPVNKNITGRWSVSSGDIVSVDSMGKLIALKAGFATVTFISESFLTAKCSVTVAAKHTPAPNPAPQPNPAVYTVIFDSNGGSAVKVQSVTAGGKAAEPAPPTKGGAVFQGWFKDLQFVSPWDFAQDVVNSDMVLYAKWLQVFPSGAASLPMVSGSGSGGPFFITDPAGPDGGYILQFAKGFAGNYSDVTISSNIIGIFTVGPDGRVMGGSLSENSGETLKCVLTFTHKPTGAKFKLSFDLFIA